MSRQSSKVKRLDLTTPESERAASAIRSPVSRLASVLSSSVAEEESSPGPSPEDILNSEILTRLRDVFSVCSTECEGKSISTGDVGLVMRAAGLCPTQEQVRLAEREADPEGTGAVSYDTFLAMVAPKMQDNSLTETGDEVKNDLILCFRSLCSEDEYRQSVKGYISEKDLRTAMSSYGEVLTPDELSQMIREADVDKDSGFINYIDFIERVLCEIFDF